MHAKKTAPKTEAAPANPAGTTAIANWDEKLAQYADTAAAATGSAGGSFISFQGGIIKVDGNPVPNNKLSCVVVAHKFENAWYPGAYNADNPVPPDCFAFGDKDSAKDNSDMVPHSDSGNIQGFDDPDYEGPRRDEDGNPLGNCHQCWANQWKSADQGKGKACKNIRRLGLIAGDEDSLNPEDIKAADVKYAKTPVTSSAEWDGYVQSMATTLRRPPFALVTQITTAPDAKTQFKLKISLLAKVEEAPAFEALVAKHEDTMKKIEFPYTALDEPAAAPAPSRGRTVPNKFAGAAKGKPAVKTPAKRGR